MSNIDPDYSRNSDEVGILRIKPVNTEKEINYYLVVVDLPESDSLVFPLTTQDNFDPDTKTLTINFNYQGNDPAPEAPLKTYAAGIWAWQNDASDEKIDLKFVEVSGNINNKSVKKSGTYTPLKSVKDISEFPGLEVNTPRVVVVKSITIPTSYVVVVLAKTVQDNSLLLSVSPKSTDPSKLEGAFENNGGLFNNPDEYVAAIGSVNSTENEFTSAHVGDKSFTIESAEYNYSNPVIL